VHPFAQLRLAFDLRSDVDLGNEQRAALAMRSDLDRVLPTSCGSD
jgi:hypothetical protein